jgi:hypothetical protein
MARKKEVKQEFKKVKTDGRGGEGRGQIGLNKYAKALYQGITLYGHCASEKPIFQRQETRKQTVLPNNVPVHT